MPEPSPTTPPAGAPPPADAAAGRAAARSEERSEETDAWAEVEARWAEPAAHLAYLARFPDLDGLGQAGRRYRAALEARPGDATALAMKAEILKRATVVGLAMLPRTPPPSPAAGRWKRAVLVALTLSMGAALAVLTWKLLTGFPS